MSKKEWGASALAVCLFVLVGAGSGFPDTVQRDIFDGCTTGKIKYKAILDSWYRQGVLKGIRYGDGVATVSVDSRRWEGASRDAQISIGISAYCTVMNSQGKGSVFVEGGRQERLGTVTDGNWFNP